MIANNPIFDTNNNTNNHQENNSIRQYTFSEVENLLNEKRDIEQKNAALKAEIAEVEAACIKVDSNEMLINNRMEGIKFDIAKGKETSSDLEDRLAELEGKRKRAEEQQQIFQLFEEFDDSFTVPTVESVGDTADIISKDNTDSLEDDSSSDEEALHYTPFETPILEDEVVEINGDKDDCTIYYRTNPEDEVILASQVDNAEMDNLMDSVEEDENIEEVISNAEIATDLVRVETTLAPNNIASELPLSEEQLGVLATDPAIQKSVFKLLDKRVEAYKQWDEYSLNELLEGKSEAVVNGGLELHPAYYEFIVKYAPNTNVTSPLSREQYEEMMKTLRAAFSDSKDNIIDHDNNLLVTYIDHQLKNAFAPNLSITDGTEWHEIDEELSLTFNVADKFIADYEAAQEASIIDVEGEYHDYSSTSQSIIKQA